MKTSEYGDLTAKTRLYYEKHAGEYRDKVGKTRDMSEYMARFLKHVPEGGTILDAGCGPGFETVEFLKRGYSVIAVDICPEMLQLAEKAAADAGFSPGPRLEFRRMSLSGLGSVAGVFDKDRWQIGRFVDGVWSCASIVHLNRIEAGSAVANFAACLAYNRPLLLTFKTSCERLLKEYGNLDESRQVKEVWDTDSEGRTFFYHDPRLIATRLNSWGMHVKEWNLAIPQGGQWVGGRPGIGWEWEAMLCIQKARGGLT